MGKDRVFAREQGHASFRAPPRPPMRLCCLGSGSRSYSIGSPGKVLKSLVCASAVPVPRNMELTWSRSPPVPSAVSSSSEELGKRPAESART